MAEEHDSWLSGIDVDLSGVADSIKVAASSVADAAQNAISSAPAGSDALDATPAPTGGGGTGVPAAGATSGSSNVGAAPGGSAGSGRKLTILEPRPNDLQHLVDVATTLQQYVGALYSNLASKTTPEKPLSTVFYPELSKIDGDIGVLLGQAQRGAQAGTLPAQEYADTIFGLADAKTKLDGIVIRSGLARPSQGGQVINSMVDAYGGTIDLRDVNTVRRQLPTGVIPGTPVEYGSDDLLHKKP